MSPWIYPLTPCPMSTVDTCAECKLCRHLSWTLGSIHWFRAPSVLILGPWIHPLTICSISGTMGECKLCHHLTWVRVPTHWPCVIWVRWTLTLNVNYHLSLVAWSASSHYQDQCRIIVNLTLKNKLQWYINQHSYPHSRKCIWKCRLRNVGHFVSTSMCYLTVP